MSEVIDCKMIFATSFHRHMQICFKTHDFSQLVMSFESGLQHLNRECRSQSIHLLEDEC